MKHRTLLRNLHIKIGTVVALPLVLSAVTALLLSHNREMGFKHINVNLAWLPKIQSASGETVLATIQSGLTTRDGRYFAGTRYGLYVLESGQLNRVDAIPGTDVRSLRETDKGILLASKVGVWLLKGSKWRHLYKGEVWEADLAPDGSFHIVSKADGLLSSRDEGQHWSPVLPVNNAITRTQVEIDLSKVPLDKLLLDLHTGNALFGRPMRWIWIDFVALPLLFLALSGLYLWYRSRKHPKQVR